MKYYAWNMKSKGGPSIPFVKLVGPADDVLSLMTAIAKTGEYTPHKVFVLEPKTGKMHYYATVGFDEHHVERWSQE